VSLVFLVLCLTVLLGQLLVPRRFAFLPLLIATCHLPNEPVLELGVSFTITKLLILVGLLRALFERRRFWSVYEPLDILFLLWTIWAILSGCFHNPPDHNPITTRLSLAYESLGVYLYGRSFLRTPADVSRFGRCLALTTVPVAVLMVSETVTGENVYANLGAPSSEVRDGRIRANGPFSHSILAGTVGAVSFPLVLYHRTAFTVVGIAACVAMAVSSHSSGPLITFAIALLGLLLWRWRRSLRRIRAAAVAGLIALHIVMNAPVWFLIARIDLTGSSTSYYRAELISQAINHFGEWWLTGTDYTRHWMQTGSIWSADQADLPNYYIRMGVTGGLTLLLLFVAIIAQAFRSLGRRMRSMRADGDRRERTLWCVGTTLAAYAVAFISVTPFDQSYVFFCLLLGAVPGIAAKSPKQHTQAQLLSSPQLSNAI
jgi:hypothetical protein